MWNLFLVGIGGFVGAIMRYGVSRFVQQAEWGGRGMLPYGTLVVNVADLLARWTDGAYVSTPHRVMNTSGRERLSLVLAYDPNPETPIDSRDIFGPDHVPASEPTTCGDYLTARFARAFAYRNKGS